jgi:hypothetical protein
MAIKLEKILPKIRQWVLILATQPSTGYNKTWRGFDLSRISNAVHENRGHVQAALMVLAREGIVFSRTHPECTIARYDRPIDKIFRIRISQQDAMERLIQAP